MRKLGLKPKYRNISKYNSHKGTIGKIAPNHLLNTVYDENGKKSYEQRDFKTTGINQKWCTDVTEFKIFDSKIYLSPILDMYNSEIISYDVSLRADKRQIDNMISKAIETLKGDEKLILHSDQGWQYQMKTFQRTLRENNITQSMSRKGNCLDNSLIENFFGRMKTEMFYGYTYSSVEELVEAIHEYIYYYNNFRIKEKLKGMTPIEYRIHSSN